MVPVTVETVWVNVHSRIKHRDPGCTRLMMKLVANRRAGRAEEFGILKISAGLGSLQAYNARPCSYCYSAAGFRRYPRRG